jgi:hypothetical protein
MFSAIQMDSVIPDSESYLRKTRLLGVVFIIYSVVLPLVTLVLPAPEVSAGPGVSLITWVMLLMMPIEILLLYLVYRYLAKKSAPVNIMGTAALMYIFAVAPSVYAFVIGFIDSSFRYLAIPLGLVFSLTGFWLALVFLQTLSDKVVSSNQ